MADEMTSGAVHRPGIAFAEYTHDRIAERRSDEAWLAAAWSDPAARVLEMRADRLPTYETGQAAAHDHGGPRTADRHGLGSDDEPGSVRIAWRSAVSVDLAAADQSGAVRVLLGQRDGVAHLALLHPAPPDAEPEVDPAATGQPPARWTTLRAVVQGLASDDAPFALHAVGLAEWHRALRHCPRCGERVRPAQAGHTLVCTGCGRHHFPRTDPAVIMLVATGEGEQEQCLLGRHPSWPSGRYSTLAGFVEPGETLEDAVRREVVEETGVRVGEVIWEGDQPWPFPASLMAGFSARAETTDIAVDGEEIEHARWFTRSELGECAASGEIALPGGVSISRTLIERWYGEPLPGRW